MGFGKIIADKWDILMMSPGAFAAVLGFGFVLGLAITRAFLNERLTRQQMRIADLEKVLDGKLAASFLPPPQRKRSKQMSLGLILILVGAGSVIAGALMVAFEKPAHVAKGENKAPDAVAPSSVTATVQNPIPPPSSPPASLDPEEAQRQQRKLLLESRGKLELAARDASGAPISIEIKSGNDKLHLKDGETGYSVQVGIAHSFAAWIYPTSDSPRGLFVSKILDHGKTIDIRSLRPSKGSDTMQIGEHAFVILPDGKTVQLVLTGLQWYRAGDDLDELRFKYKIYPAGEFLFDSL